MACTCATFAWPQDRSGRLVFQKIQRRELTQHRRLRGPASSRFAYTPVTSVDPAGAAQRRLADDQVVILPEMPERLRRLFPGIEFWR